MRRIAGALEWRLPFDEQLPRVQPTFVVWSTRFTCVFTGIIVKNSAMSSGNMRMQPCVTCMPTPAGRLVPWIR